MDAKVNAYHDDPLVFCSQAEKNSDLEQIKKKDAWLMLPSAKCDPYSQFLIRNAFSLWDHELISDHFCNSLSTQVKLQINGERMGQSLDQLQKRFPLRQKSIST